MIHVRTFTAAAAALVLAAVTMPTARAAEAPVAVRIVDALNQRFGVHPGFRANHAKGLVAYGSFTPTRAAASLSRSPLFAGAVVPVTVRFSDSGGLPAVADAAPLANPHGMALKFHLPGGGETDLVANAFRFFPVATAGEFLALQLAAATSPPGTPPSPRLREFLAGHPSVARANATVGTPASFAEERYFGVNAFVFVNAAGTRQPFRHIVEPVRVVHLDPATAARQPPDYLMTDLPARLARGPVVFRLTAQLAAPGDPTGDATRPWPDSRPVVELGTLTIDRIAPDSTDAEKKLLFLPGRLTDGIEPSDDPLIAARDAAYAVSFGRRSGRP